jgi:glucokinase
LTSPLLLVLDFGGTKHSAALLEPGASRWLDHQRRPSPPGANAAIDLKIVFDIAHDLLRRHDARPAAIGVSFGGPVDFTRGVVRLSHHVAGWESIPLRERVEAEFGAPAGVDNDANCGAVGEWLYGAGREAGANFASLLYMTVSTGIGGGWVIGGEVYRGADGMAGEIGHITVDPSGPICVCGRRGCLEVLACGTAIARRARERLSVEPMAGAELRRLSGGAPEAVTSEMVSRAAAAGDALAEAVLLEAARDLGRGIGSALSLMNPALVVLGGGVTRAGKGWWAAVRQAARASTLPEISAPIVPAALGEDAPLWGAVALVAVK